MAGSLPRFWRCAAVAGFVGLCLLDGATAAEPTEAEKLYERLNESEQHSDKLLADRWNKVVRQRQWVDATGKHRTYARYLDHDPDLKWVKLLILVKKGETPTYKEGQLPLTKLSKNDQATVKRIAILRKQVDDALANSPGGEGYSLEGEALESRGAEPGVEGGEPMTVESAVESAPVSLPSLRPDQPWRADFATFAANLSATQREDGKLALNWGELQDLKAVHDQERGLAMLKQIPSAQRPQAMLYQQGFVYGWNRSGLGPVIWQANLVGSADGVTHDLVLPEPFKLELLPDPQVAGDASRFGQGTPVQFVGRFAELGGFGETPVLKMYIRLPTDQPATGVASISPSSSAPQPELVEQRHEDPRAMREGRPDFNASGK